MELGPIIKSLRHHKGAFSLLVLEVAFGFVILVHTVVGARFYLGMGWLAGTGIKDEEIVVVDRQFLQPKDLETARGLERRDLARLRALPEVEAAAAFDEPPLPDVTAFPLLLRPSGTNGPPRRGPAQRPAMAWPTRVTPDGPAVLGVEILAGQSFEAIPAGTQPVPVLVTRTLADALFGAGAPAVGRTIADDAWGEARVVGVVKDFRFHGAWMPDNTSSMLISTEPVSEQGLVYAVRATPKRRAAVVSAVRAAMEDATDSAVTVRALDRSAARYWRLSSGATFFFCYTGFLVVAVAVAGSLALSSFSVIERTRQIGVRRALGARRGEIVSYFLVENLVLTGLGLALGLALAALLNVFVRRLMSDLVMTPGAILLSMGIFVVTGLLSAMVPARRAAAIPPWAATRTL